MGKPRASVVRLTGSILTAVMLASGCNRASSPVEVIPAAVNGTTPPAWASNVCYAVNAMWTVDGIVHQCRRQANSSVARGAPKTPALRTRAAPVGSASGRSRPTHPLGSGVLDGGALYQRIQGATHEDRGDRLSEQSARESWGAQSEEKTDFAEVATRSAKSKRLS
jgi:hypothetical protein